MARISKAFTRRLMGDHALIGLLFGAVICMIRLSVMVIVLADQLGRCERRAAPLVHDVSPERLAATGALAGMPLAAAHRTMTFGGLAMSLAVQDARRIADRLKSAIAIAAVSLALLHGWHDGLIDPASATIDGLLPACGAGWLVRRPLLKSVLTTCPYRQEDDPKGDTRCRFDAP